jgi:hypothetical protein
LFESTQGNLGALYQHHIKLATKHFGALNCDSRYGLEHCATVKEEDPSVFPNEFFFDSKSNQTLVECKRIALHYGDFLACHHYFVTPEINAVAEVGYGSFEEIALWQSVSVAIRKIAVSLIYK